MAQILAAVANIQMRNLKAEEGKGFLWNVMLQDWDDKIKGKP